MPSKAVAVLKGEVVNGTVFFNQAVSSRLLLSILKFLYFILIAHIYIA